MFFLLYDCQSIFVHCTVGVCFVFCDLGSAMVNHYLCVLHSLLLLNFFLRGSTNHRSYFTFCFSFLFFSPSLFSFLFGTCIWKILGAVGIWQHIFGGFCFDVYFTNTYNVGALFFVTYS